MGLIVHEDTDPGALQAALQDTLAMARDLRADLAVRECAGQAPNLRGRTLLWSLQARADELRAQIATSRCGVPA